MSFKDKYEKFNERNKLDVKFAFALRRLATGGYVYNDHMVSVIYSIRGKCRPRTGVDPSVANLGVHSVNGRYRGTSPNRTNCILALLSQIIKEWWNYERGHSSKRLNHYLNYLVRVADNWEAYRISGDIVKGYCLSREFKFEV